MCFSHTSPGLSWIELNTLKGKIFFLSLKEIHAPKVISLTFYNTTLHSILSDKQNSSVMVESLRYKLKKINTKHNMMEMEL